MNNVCMDYRESIIEMLMHDIDTPSLIFIYGATWAAYKDAREREEARNYTHPRLSRKMCAIRSLLEIDSDRFLNRIYVSLREYLKENGGVDG